MSDLYRDVRQSRNRRLHSPRLAPEGDYRRPAQRDRDRIIYTSAFRRLAQVSQVASPADAHVFHNRLTHSLQVAQVGRSLAERLRQDESACQLVGGIDPETVEAACLAHDLGHPPFGHTGEEQLNRLVGSMPGGFEGNAQSFRIVTKLAFKSPKHAGLDLTAATLAAILKYPWVKGTNPKQKKKWGAYSSERVDFTFARKICGSGKFNPSPEAALMDWADDVTYSVHDVEDFFRAGKIPVHLLARANENAERRRFFDDVYRRRAKSKDFPTRPVLEEAFENTLGMYWRIYEPYSGTKDHRSRLRFFTSKLIHRYINAVTLDTRKKTINIDDEYAKEVKILKELTWTYVIESPSLALQRQGHREVISRLFEVYADAADSESERSIFPPYYREEIEKANSTTKRTRLVCDLIAGMTEPEAVEQYRQIMSGGPPLSLQEIVR